MKYKDILKSFIFLILFFANINIVFASTSIPVGTIEALSGTSIPADYLVANGQSLSTTTYAALFKVIGYTYGGSGTSFKLPNLNGRAVVGISTSDSSFNTLGKTGGEAEHVLTVNEIPSHTHIFTGNAHSHSFSGTSTTTSSAGSHTHSYSATSNSAGEHSHGYSNNISQGNHSHDFNGGASAREARSYGLVAGGSIWYDQILVTGGGVGFHATGNHSHTFNFTTGTGGAHTHDYDLTSASAGGHTHTVIAKGTVGSATTSGTNSYTGTGKAHNNLQPYMALRYVIKVK